MKPKPIAVWGIVALLASILLFLIVAPRKPHYDFGESTRRMMDGNAKINRILDSVSGSDTTTKSWIDSLYEVSPEAPSSGGGSGPWIIPKHLSYGGGVRVYTPITEGDVTMIYSTKENPTRITVGPCEAELPEGDYTVTMKDGVISVSPIQSTKNK